ncbi:sucrose porin [Klebsiella michiganensis]|nr:sucrose porin [Klebsiella michiganensis]
MDIDPKGFNGNRAASGSYYKLTFAPTFKMQNVTDFFERPEIRFFATWMRWDKSLDDYSSTDTFAAPDTIARGRYSSRPARNLVLKACLFD